ncbi:hypothetical protein EF902_37035 [Streptomyces sp. WAC05858]|nr:hypothetical protein EF902_37035 [Streptomyces sp. WAC05858]
MLPVEYREVSGPRRSFESTRPAPWPANCFMSSVTAPCGPHLGLLALSRVQSSGRGLPPADGDADDSRR